MAKAVDLGGYMSGKMTFLSRGACRISKVLGNRRREAALKLQESAEVILR